MRRVKIDPKTKNQQVTIKVTEDKPESLELIATQIKEISEVFKKIESSPLKQKTIILLLHHATGLPQGTVKVILDTAPQLAKMYLK